VLESGDEAAQGANESLGRRLRELRTQSGLSLRALARSLDISASAVSQFETGVMVPSVNRLIAIVTALGVPLSAAFEAPGAESAAASTAAATLGDRLAGIADEPVEGDGYVISRAGRVPDMKLESGVVYRRLSPGPVPGLEIFESTYPAGSTGSAHGHPHDHVRGRRCDPVGRRLDHVSRDEAAPPQQPVRRALRRCLADRPLVEDRDEPARCVRAAARDATRR